MSKKDIIKRTLIISFIIILIDQISKIIAIKICENSDIEIIKNIFYFSKATNIGLAFSINEDNFKNIFISGIIIVFILSYLFKQRKFLNPISLTCLDLVVAGGVSNLIDRIFRGGVIDFIRILDFPIFNLADCIVIIGWGLFAFYIIKFEFIIPKKGG